MIGKFVKGKTYVFIDAANLENSVKAMGWWLDYKKLYGYFKNETDLVGMRHYCPRFNDLRQDNFFTALKHIGIKLITKPLKIIAREKEVGNLRKANFDVEITLDASQLANEYDCLVLFSGDSDFDYLIKFLRQKGKKVVVISNKHHISRELIASCDKYIDLRAIKGFLERKRT